ncbi:MAG: dephospho-CoA kinase [Mycoplasma sp.]
MKILITGETNSGKSTIIRFLKNAGIKCFIADEYVAEIYQNYGIGYKAILDTFGIDYVYDGNVDKQKLSNLIFSDKNAFDLLCKTIWPLIRKGIEEFSLKYSVCIIELAIYKVDKYNIFDNLFDIKINITSTFNIKNKKSKFSNFYENISKNDFDYQLVNNSSIETSEKIIKVINDALV